jgi:hypothetical protein
MLLFALGLQAFLILKDLKIMIEKINKVLSNVDSFSEKIIQPRNWILSLIHGLKATFSIADSLSNKKHRGEVLFEIKKGASEILHDIEEFGDTDLETKTEAKTSSEEKHQNQPSQTKVKSPLRRFFNRGSK